MPIALAAALLAAQDTAELPSIGSLMTKMMTKYSQAESLVGKVEAEVRVKGERVRVKTEIQYQRPNLIYIMQVQEYKAREEFFVVSDGQKFQYTNPLDHLRKRDPFLIETAVQERQEVDDVGKVSTRIRPLGIGSIYAAGSLSLADRSIPLDMAIGRTEDLQYFRGQLATFKDGGMVEFAGKKARKIHGDWRPFADAANNLATYELYITPEGDFVGYRLSEIYSMNKQVVPMVSTWVSDFKPGAEVDRDLFKLRTR
jgi:hypothetical protein